MARRAGIGGRINTVMQACFFAISGVLPLEEALPRLTEAVRTSYGKRGAVVVDRNLAAIDAATAELHQVPVPEVATSTLHRRPAVPEHVPEFVARVTGRMIAGEGDLLPVSALPVDGAFPTGTAAYEKRTIATKIPIWEPDLCIDCGKCTIVCPHAAIRMSVFDPAENPDHADLPSKGYRNREKPGLELTIQVAPDDCTGCGVCVGQCPAFDKSEVRRKAINMRPIEEHLEVERTRWDAFLEITPADQALWSPDTVKTSQMRQPLMEFSGACSGCGETPVPEAHHPALRRPAAGRQRHRLLVDLRRQPADDALHRQRRRPGPGVVQLAVRGQRGVRPGHAHGLRAPADPRPDPAGRARAPAGPGPRGPDRRRLHRRGRPRGSGRSGRTSPSWSTGCPAIADEEPRAAALIDLSTALVRRTFWIIGGDGWAYDIGYGGLDHVLASGRDVNILVMDTEVYSNTGGQQSKATPRGAVAKFAAAGKGLHKKDLGLEAMAYGDVYVAQIALGANEIQTVKALVEAEAHHGPSLVIAYSTCIAHGFDMADSMGHQKLAVNSGHWPLYRYRPAAADGAPFQLDSKAPSIPFGDFAQKEARFAMLFRSDPARAKELMARSEEDIAERWRYYEQLAGVQRAAPLPDPNGPRARRIDEGESDE